MTTIIANRKMVVSDSKITAGSTSFSGPKLYRKNGAIIASAGDAGTGNKFLKWFGTGAEAPKIKKSIEFSALVLTKSGLYLYENDFEPVEISDDVYAIGSGGDLALMAVRHYGASLEEAVRAACSTDVNSGGELQVMYLRREVAGEKASS